MDVKLKKIFFVFFLSLIFISCTPVKSFGKAEFGADCDYYLGLRALENENEKEAANRFSKCLKTGSPLVARRSAESLCNLGDIQDKINAAKKLVSMYNDEEAQLLAARIYSEFNEQGLVLNLTSKMNIREANDELVSIRMKAMVERNIPGLEEALIEWFLWKPITSYHYNFFCDYMAGSKKSSESGSSFEKIFYLINFRTEVYAKNYRTALLESSQVEAIIKYNPNLLTDQIMSDIGKSHLYESSDQMKSARHFKELAEEYVGKSVEFYCWFYSARLYEKANASFSRISSAYESAIQCTDKTSLKDNALWYLLRGALQNSAEECIGCLKKYTASIGDANYYDDFFDLLCPLLLTEGRYEEIGSVYKMIQGVASKETVSKFAYIYARLLEERIYIPSESVLHGRTVDEEKQAAYQTALESGTDIYYRVRASEALNLSERERKNIYCLPRKETEAKINPDAERLLNGYAFFGFPEKIYSEWTALNLSVLSSETAITLCSLLRNNSKGDDDFYVQSLRIAAKCVNNNPGEVPLELLKFCFPKNYSDFISKYCEKYSVDQNFMYGLIRSESFFDPDVKSSAGALGLCQLMPFTADDVAHRLRKGTYDITDAETSIEFGTYYFANLLERMDGSYLDACYSYNAGISRVRKWKKSSALGFNMKSVPEDLFLETLPYPETREYGRKCYSAAAMYQWLYK
ncbi:MAG: lytic transglycosylase domain-containing protein [Treponema sp.]|nr:lytic transglycosylase domain-containing protein [Treponema sp.]